MTINDILSLKAARRDASANQNWLWEPGDTTSDLIFMVLFTLDIRRHLIRLAPAPSISYRLAKFGWIPFVDLHMRSLTMKLNAEHTEGG